MGALKMKIIISVVLAMLGMGCANKEHLVRLSEQTLPKTTSIIVSGIAERPVLKYDGKDTFWIETATVPVKYTGAGVYISEYNHVLTCDHLFTMVSISSVVVCDYYGVCSDAEILFRESAFDLALLKTKAASRSDFARLADYRQLRVGQAVIAIGNPLGFPFSVSHGIISALHRDSLGVSNMTQSDAFLNPGNSGGGLFNMDGDLIGINSRILPPVRGPVFTGLGFSVQPEQIAEFLSRFRGLEKATADTDEWPRLRAVLYGEQGK